MSTIFGLFITLAAYKLSEYLKQYKFFSKIPPICFAAFLIIGFMNLFSLDYKQYNQGGELIVYLLGPATVALALPFVKNTKILILNWKIILVGVCLATLTGITSVLLVAKLLKTTNPIILSLIPKSVTTPIAVQISKSIGGIPNLTACIVIITGIIGALFGHKILKLIRVKNHISIGLAIGASSHVIGTSRCLEKNELQAAISSISLILTGILTAISAPIILGWVN